MKQFASRRIPGLACLLGSMFVAPTLAAQGIELELQWELGGIEARPEVLWEGRLGATLSGDAVYVSDSRAPSLRAFSHDGEFIAEFGREGQGPGEFALPSFAGSRGDSIVVWDVRLRREVVFHRDGQHVDTRTIRPYPNLRYSTLADHVGQIGGVHIGLTATVIDDSVVFPQALIQWSAPEAVDTLGLIQGILVMTRLGGEGQWNAVGTSLGPAGDLDTLGDSLIVFLDGTAPELSIFRRDASGVRQITRARLPGTPIRLDAGDKERVLERLLADRSPRWREREFRIPDAIPAWSSVRANTDGSIWLLRGGSSELLGGPERWSRWNAPAGNPQQFTLPTGERLLDMSGDMLVTTRSGEFDEVYLRLYRMTSG